MTEFDKQKTLSVLLMALGVALLLLVATSCTKSRAHPAQVFDGSIGAPADVAEQNARAVRVAVACKNDAEGKLSYFGASGVAIGGRLVLTAAHVVEGCMGPAELRVQDAGGAWYDAKILDTDWATDILLLGVEWEPVPLVTFGPKPRKLSKLCAVTAHPIRTRICGVVVRVDPGGPGAIVNSLATRPGNSGSGVYDEAGGLIGIVITGCKVPGCGYTGASRLDSVKERLGL